MPIESVICNRHGKMKYEKSCQQWICSVCGTIVTDTYLELFAKEGIKIVKVVGIKKPFIFR